MLDAPRQGLPTLDWSGGRGEATLCIGGVMDPPKFFKTSLIIGKRLARIILS